MAKRWVVKRTLAWLNRCLYPGKDWKNVNYKARTFLLWAPICLMVRRLCQPSPRFSSTRVHGSSGSERIMLWLRFSSNHRTPQCRRTVVLHCSNSHPLKAAMRWRALTALHPPWTLAPCCSGGPTGRSGGPSGLPAVSAIHAARTWGSLKPKPW